MGSALFAVAAAAVLALHPCAPADGLCSLAFCADGGAPFVSANQTSAQACAAIGQRAVQRAPSEAEARAAVSAAQRGWGALCGWVSGTDDGLPAVVLAGGGGERWVANFNLARSAAGAFGVEMPRSGDEPAAQSCTESIGGAWVQVCACAGQGWATGANCSAVCPGGRDRAACRALYSEPLLGRRSARLAGELGAPILSFGETTQRMDACALAAKEPRGFSLVLFAAE